MEKLRIALDVPEPCRSCRRSILRHVLHGKLMLNVMEVP